MIFPINLSNSNTFIYDFLSNNIDVSLSKNISSEKNILLEILKMVVMHSNDKIRKRHSIQELCTALNATRIT
jgi:CRISPR/Cas system CSM-associated protein Csm2 small subunit